MAMNRKIIDVKNPLLRRKSKEVKTIDKKILGLIADMRETLKAQKDPEGVGLAAPQIGKNLRIFLIYYNGIEHVIINPRIVSKPNTDIKTPYEGKNKVLEGCLSLPHYYGPIKRAKKITLTYMDENGKTTTRDFKGFLAHIIQHEIDHLEGVLFIDRILEQKGPLYRFKGDDWEEVELNI
jgi:peptide deformylase